MGVSISSVYLTVLVGLSLDPGETVVAHKEPFKVLFIVLLFLGRPH